MGNYGKELILDLHSCDPVKFSRDSLQRYFVELCELIGMERCELHFWDDVGVPEGQCQVGSQTKGTSAVQFILTSSLVIHTLDLLAAVYVNLFSCKDFDADKAAAFTLSHFDGRIVQRLEVDRL